MTPAAFLTKAVPLAVKSGHLFPGYAACEAAEESAWGASELARDANNLFGQKQGHTTIDMPYLALPTREYIHGLPVVVQARFVSFPDWSASFAARMALLRTLASERDFDGQPAFAGYLAALAATTGPDFIAQVSKDWSTDPQRAKTVLSIYAAHAVLIQKLLEEPQG